MITYTHVPVSSELLVLLVPIVSYSVDTHLRVSKILNARVKLSWWARILAYLSCCTKRWCTSSYSQQTFCWAFCIISWLTAMYLAIPFGVSSPWICFPLRVIFSSIVWMVCAYPQQLRENKTIYENPPVILSHWYIFSLVISYIDLHIAIPRDTILCMVIIIMIIWNCSSELA